MKFSNIEVKQLLLAWLLVSTGFAIAQAGGVLSIMQEGLLYLILMLGASLATVGIGFVLHEIGHKFVAQRFGCYAEFRYDMQMLLASLVMSLFGFFFVAPGAVMIHGNLTKNKYGLVSLAGPLTNLLLAIIFLSSGLILNDGLISSILFFGFNINSWIALFNMIPIMNFDGAKIFAWNKVVYIGTVFAAGILMILSGYLQA
ncbi:MAG: hypothetical protein V1859_09645 [archaeon]